MIGWLFVFAATLVLALVGGIFGYSEVGIICGSLSLGGTLTSWFYFCVIKKQPVVQTLLALGIAAVPQIIIVVYELIAGVIELRWNFLINAVSALLLEVYLVYGKANIGQ